MNSILTMTLLAAGLAGNVFVYGQVPLVPRLSLPNPRLSLPTPRLSPFPSSPVLPGQKKGSSFFAPLAKPGSRDTEYFLKVMVSNSIVMMWPDNMRCLVPSLAELEPMPVRQPFDVHSSRGYDPMPNGYPSDHGGPWLQAVPRKRQQ